MKPEQQPLIAPNSVSIAEAHYHEAAWIRAVYANDEPIRFVMLHDENLRRRPEVKDFYAL